MLVFLCRHIKYKQDSLGQLTVGTLMLALFSLESVKTEKIKQWIEHLNV